MLSPWNADDPQRPFLDSADASAQLIIARYSIDCFFLHDLYILYIYSMDHMYIKNNA
jgi:hypothetical protein